MNKDAKELDALIAENNRLWHGQVHVVTEEERRALNAEAREARRKLYSEREK
ncbi:hypothetical protein [Companilactobacillus ginsenosidimutans]|uniref:hypothetical protein n=1 Tax=Companilactobacillus ginsenosidimutans TaxID=1007676 RepID=UPI000AB99909|nr:hypothetical protein [Companilactobacillus ginsenosidimutans]